MNINYKQYTIEDFIADESFVAWCNKGVDNESWSALAQSEDLKVKINEAKLIVAQLNAQSNQDHSINTSIKNNLWKRIDDSTSTKVVSINRKYINYAIASIAACFLLVFAYNTLKGNISDADTKTILAANTLEKITLPDQSSVSVKQGSTISYDNGNFINKRTVRLKGHAFFKVEKGSEFNVITDQGTVRVLGTSFDVIENKNGLKVVCFTGRVEVVSNGKKVVLNPGEETDFSNSTFKNSVVLYGDTPSYISGKFSFENIAMAELVKLIEKEYDITIRADQNFLSKSYSGGIVLDNIDNVLKSITWPYHMTFSKDGKEVTIINNGK